MKLEYKVVIVRYLLCDLVPKSDNRAQALDNMQRAINALTGAGGRYFRRAPGVGNPCQGMPGGGIVADLEQLGETAAATLANEALEAAASTLTATTLDQVKQAASQICTRCIQPILETLSASN